jgi:hypothetical protein
MNDISKIQSDSNNVDETLLELLLKGFRVVLDDNIYVWSILHSNPLYGV